MHRSLRFLTPDGGLKIGPLVVHRDLEKSAHVREKFSALFEAARSVTSVQIRAMGTLGGNICLASPAADSSPALIALGAQRAKSRGAEKPGFPLEDFFVATGKTGLKPGELRAEFQIPDPGTASGSAFLKLTRVAADLAKVNVAAFVQREKDACRECRIASGAVAPTPVRRRKAEMHACGRAMLIGTRSVAASETASRLLNAAGLPHEVLNARQDAREAEIIAQAGQPGRITVATNMAGRGTDILLSPVVREAGGLHVILTEYHDAARIDRQLFGRARRQGDPGSCEAIVALDDELFVAHASRLREAMRARATRDGLLPDRFGRVLRKIAQAAAERQNSRVRRQTVEMDKRVEKSLAFAGRGE